ncbi:Fis family transcriptional regulator [Halobacillus andaensis]|uniref:Fis family transcriptional regulator n=1 Tax=Halobacillus andaensis TaxID=1176239 RepID=A0A917B2P3_HALAA|nr:sigma 54-interacting transcriptional regulator [Halobacillus andaensis]MBP2004722.1 transcriptional regulator with PAS, ATPase and Fis domain [Halobacillus andaensis]GGF19498.1 Fis family transcriptional regulator [Halobacillus andaensis]
MHNSLTLIAGTLETKHTLHQQLEEILGEFIDIESFAVDEFLPNNIHNDLIIYSSKLVEEEAGEAVDAKCPTITAQRTVNYQHIDRLFELPYRTTVLCVNDTPEMTKETIHTLEKIGMNHLRYVSSQSSENRKNIRTAVTPGEVSFIPRNIEKVVDIGVRLIDITTLFEVLDHFKLQKRLGSIISSRYTSKIIELSKKISEMHQKTQTLNEHLKQVVDGVNDGIMAVDLGGKVTVFNPFMEEYTGISSSQALGKTLPQLFKQPDLLQFLSQPQKEGRYFTMNTYNVMVYRFQWEDSDSVIMIFKNTDETITMERAARQQLTKTGYIAKYHFQDIIGESMQLKETKRIAKKLAASELPVLIQGESGTGKELFASAIHNHSSLKLEPFLAVNCSALPEDLLESELFGYEEGAFTGAKRGGKKGLFEQANGGTIFLDEIGDISLKLQARLLRVIQEMEIRKIGGNKNIPIDVRVIAATNKDLLHLIEEGKFREDLYHRLKVLFLHVPSLRKRKEDIPTLVHQFLIENGERQQVVNLRLMKVLKDYQWPGNIRELKNTIAYLMTVREGREITEADLPSQTFFQTTDSQFQPSQPSVLDQRKFTSVLTILLKLNEGYESASRQKISEYSRATDYPLSVQQVRKVLKELESHGYVHVKRGRGGTEITESGKEFLQQ